ncbi:MAG TPA: rod shape-determining protein MreD [Candidatus Babeliaceae bacterium]|nr:rod shape-determining protein MreD [Candidatus Babeliaceae bacterium]
MSNSESIVLIIITFIAALILTLMPMPGWTVWLRPAWVLLIIVYWTMVAPYRVNVGIAWFLGIILDVLNGTLLGEHALALTISTYVVSRMYSRLNMFPLLQQGLIIFFLVMLYQFIIFCIQGFIGELPHGWLYWSPCVTSMLLWPWVYSIIGNCRRRLKVA